jgi:hypothetical protein
MDRKIEAVIICVNYSDFLHLNLFKNLKHFDNIIVVTHENDYDTLKTILEYSNSDRIKAITTDVFHQNGAKFNKGLAINIGFKELKYKDWVITLDSDIILPDNFRKQFLKFAQDIECSYSARRYDIQSYNEWLQIETNPSFLKGKRLFRGIGYGYFFCFNYNSKIFQKLLIETKGLPYPHWFAHGSESDWIFRNYWSDWVYDPPLDGSYEEHETQNKDRPKNEKKLKEFPFQVIHLGQTGVNATARLTPIFKI